MDSISINPIQKGSIIINSTSSQSRPLFIRWTQFIERPKFIQKRFKFFIKSNRYFQGIMIRQIVNDICIGELCQVRPEYSSLRHALLLFLTKF